MGPREIGVTWLGTASVRVETPGAVLLTDPFIQFPGGEHPNRAGDFLGAENILITHAHLDHLASLPELLRLWEPQVWCTDCAARLLEREAPGARLRRIRPGDVFSVGDVEVAVLSGKHIRFDTPPVLRTLSPFHLARHQKNVLPLLRLNRRYRECDETVFYELRAYGLRIQLMGSLALRDGVDYPAGADVLLLPYQGSSHLEEAAERVLRVLRPKRVIATHFDNAFPPISQTIPTDTLVALVAREFPACQVTVPEYGQTIWL